MPEPEPLGAVRVVAAPAALDALAPEPEVLRLADDEVLVLDVHEPIEVDDPHAIVVIDSGWVRFRCSSDQGAAAMSRLASWPPPARGLGQGMVAGVPAKVVVGDDEWSFIVSHAVAAEFGARL